MWLFLNFISYSFIFYIIYVYTCVSWFGFRPCTLTTFGTFGWLLLSVSWWVLQRCLGRERFCKSSRRAVEPSSIYIFLWITKESKDSNRIPMMSSSNPRIAGDFWKTWDFQSLYLSESRKWRSAEMGQVYSWGYQGTKQVASTPIRGYYQSNQPERFKDGYRPLRMCKHFKTDQCWRGQECPSSFLRVSYETEAPLRFSLGFLFPYDVSIWFSCLIHDNYSIIALHCYHYNIL